MKCNFCQGKLSKVSLSPIQSVRIVVLAFVVPLYIVPTTYCTPIIFAVESFGTKTISSLPSPACDDTANSVMTPKLILPGTLSKSIQKLTHDIATIRMDGK